MNRLSSQQQFATCQWRHQIASRDWSQLAADSLKNAAVGYMVRGKVRDRLIKLDRFVVVVLRYVQTRNDNAKIQITGFRGLTVPWGVKWGGPDASIFEKNLALQPRKDAHGRRLDLKQPQLIKIALQIDRKFWGSSIHENSPRSTNSLRLPKLWAAFDRVRDVEAAGPEFEAMCKRRRQTPRTLLKHYRRRHDQLLLLPMNWVSHVWEDLAEIYVDLDRYPKTQIVDAQLSGYRGATEFDFRRTRFSKRSKRRSSLGRSHNAA